MICILYSMAKPQQILCISITGPFLKIINYEKKVLYILFSMFLISKSFAQVAEISSPDGQLKLHVFSEEGKASYNVILQGKTMLEKSPLGLVSNESDFSKNLKFIDSKKISFLRNIRTEKSKNLRFITMPIL